MNASVTSLCPSQTFTDIGYDYDIFHTTLNLDSSAQIVDLEASVSYMNNSLSFRKEILSRHVFRTLNAY